MSWLRDHLDVMAIVISLATFAWTFGADGRVRRREDRAEMRCALVAARVQLEQLRPHARHPEQTLEDLPALLEVARWHRQGDSPPVLDWRKHQRLWDDYVFEVGEGTSVYMHGLVAAEPERQAPYGGALTEDELRRRYANLEELLRDLDNWHGLFRMARRARAKWRA